MSFKSDLNLEEQILETPEESSDTEGKRAIRSSEFTRYSSATPGSPVSPGSPASPASRAPSSSRAGGRSPLVNPSLNAARLSSLQAETRLPRYSGGSLNSRPSGSVQDITSGVGGAGATIKVPESSLLKTLMTPDASVVVSTTVAPFQSLYAHPDDITDSCNIADVYISECGATGEKKTQSSPQETTAGSTDLLSKYLLDRAIPVHGVQGRPPTTSAKCNALLQWAKDNCYQQAYGYMKMKGAPVVADYLRQCSQYQRGSNLDTKQSNIPYGLYDFLQTQRSRIQQVPNEPQTALKLTPRQFVDEFENNLAIDAERYIGDIKDDKDYQGQCEVLQLLIDRELSLTNMLLSLVRKGMNEKEKARQKMAIYNMWIPYPYVAEPKFVLPVNDLMQFHEFRNANIKYPRKGAAASTGGKPAETSSKTK